MIVSNRLLVGCERRSSGASRHQLEARKRTCRTSQLDASINDKVQFRVSAIRCVPHRQRFVVQHPRRHDSPHIGKGSLASRPVKVGQKSPAHQDDDGVELFRFVFGHDSCHPAIVFAGAVALE